jgi:hydroxymethylpyrimidine pyrophosphatase-like HAD family hydrolase
LEVKKLAREALSHIPDILTVSGGRHNLEVSHINSGKGKGLPHVKAEADYIAPSNDEDGVAAAIREFMRITR